MHYSWLLGRSPKTGFLASRSIKIGLRISVCWFPGPEGRVLEVLVFLALRYATTCRQTTIKQVIPDAGNTIIEVSYHASGLWQSYSADFCSICVMELQPAYPVREFNKN